MPGPPRRALRRASFVALLALQPISAQLLAAEPSEGGNAPVVEGAQWRSSDTPSHRCTAPNFSDAPPCGGSRWQARRFALSVTASVGSHRLSWIDVPYSGLDVDYAVVPWLSATATFGYLSGHQISIAPRLRLELAQSVALMAAPRLINRRFEHGASDCPLLHGPCLGQSREWQHSFWGGGDVGIEGRTGAGFVWRLHVGTIGLLTQRADVCLEHHDRDPATPCTAERYETDMTMVYWGVSLGHAL